MLMTGQNLKHLKHLLFLVLLMLPVAARADAPGDLVAAVRGGVQFWQRTCQSNGLCQQPVQLSDVQTIGGLIHRPLAENQLGTYSAELLSAEANPVRLKLSLQAYWRLDAHSTFGSYISVQTRLSRVVGETLLPLAECSQYLEPKPSVFPVGFCAAYRDEEGDIVQYGVSFYR